MDHQIENLTGLGLKLENFRIFAHATKCNGCTLHVQDGGRGGRGSMAAENSGQSLSSINKVDGQRQLALTLFVACQRSKSAPRIKNLRPIWTIRIRSSSMILRKCRTENPASSAAFGISRKVLLTVHPSVNFIFSSYAKEVCASCVPEVGGGVIWDFGCRMSDCGGTSVRVADIRHPKSEILVGYS